MRFLRVFACAGMVGAALVPSAARAAAAPPLVASMCRYREVGSTPTTLTWDVYGGPVVAPGSTVSLRCGIHVAQPAYADPAVFTTSTAPAANVAVLAPVRTTFAYTSPLDWIYICTEAVVDGTSWYWDYDRWTTDAGASCEQTVALFPEVDALLDPVQSVAALWDAVDAVTCYTSLACVPTDGLPPEGDAVLAYLGCEQMWGTAECWGAFDYVVCPVFQRAYGVPGVAADGDISVVGEAIWDCPPYDFS